MQLSTLLMLCGISLSAAMPVVSWQSASSKTGPTGQWFDRELSHGTQNVDLRCLCSFDTIIGFVVVVLENNNKDITFGEPYFQNLATQGMTLAQYHGMACV